MKYRKDTPLYYTNYYGLIIYKSSDKILSSEELSPNDNSMHGFTSEGFYQLEKIVLTKDIKKVEWNGLGRYRFKKFEVALDNPVFQEIDGILYTRKGHDRYGITRRTKMIELVACPTDVTTHHVMQGTIRIANCAFKGSRVSNLFIPDSVEEIGTNAFYFADNLKTIEIPLSLKKLEPQISRTPLIIRYRGKEFDSWNNLFVYLLDNGFEYKFNKIVKGK